MRFKSMADVRAIQEERTDPDPPSAEGTGLLVETSKNLLKHIPGEASGFYLISAGAFPDPGSVTLGILAVMALAILVLVRLLAKASSGILLSSVVAFLLWMLVIDNGFLAVAFPGLLPDPWGLILASFYSIVITVLATAGKIT